MTEQFRSMPLLGTGHEENPELKNHLSYSSPVIIPAGQNTIKTCLSNLTLRPPSNHAKSFKRSFPFPGNPRHVSSVQEPPSKRVKKESHREDQSHREETHREDFEKKKESSIDIENDNSDDVDWITVDNPTTLDEYEEERGPSEGTSEENVTSKTIARCETFSNGEIPPDHPLNRASSAKEMVFMMYDKMSCIEKQQQIQTEIMRKNVTMLENTVNSKVLEPPFFSEALHATIAKIIYNYAFNPADGIVLGVIYKDMNRNFKDRIRIAINKNLLLDFMSKCFPQTKVYIQQCKRMDIFLHQIAMTTEWVPSLENLVVIEKFSPAVLKKNDTAEQRQWFQFSLNAFLALEDRAIVPFPENPEYIFPPNGYIFDEKKWSHTVCQGNPLNRSFYETSGIHTIFEHICQRKIMRLFLKYTGADESILKQKKSIVASINNHGTYPYWSGDSITLNYMDIWVKAQIKMNTDPNKILLIEAEKTSSNSLDKDKMIRIWNFLFKGEMPYKVDRLKPIRHHWVQTEETIPVSSRGENNHPKIKKRGRKKDKISIDQLLKQ